MTPHEDEQYSEHARPIPIQRPHEDPDQTTLTPGPNDPTVVARRPDARDSRENGTADQTDWANESTVLTPGANDPTVAVRRPDTPGPDDVTVMMDASQETPAVTPDGQTTVIGNLNLAPAPQQTTGEQAAGEQRVGRAEASPGHQVSGQTVRGEQRATLPAAGQPHATTPSATASTQLTEQPAAEQQSLGEQEAVGEQQLVAEQEAAAGQQAVGEEEAVGEQQLVAEQQAVGEQQLVAEQQAVGGQQAVGEEEAVGGRQAEGSVVVPDAVRVGLVRGVAERLGELTEIRVRHPERVAEGWLQRRTRALVGDDGRLLIVAADHPARGALGVRGDRMAMGSRADLIARLMIALQRPGVDGVLATPDVLEDLLLLGALEGKVVIGSMNRGGLQGAAFELDDRFTAYRTADEIAARRLDGGKMLTRIDLGDPGTVATLESSAAAVTGLAEHKLMAMVEPFWSTRGEDGRVVNLLDPDSVIKSIQIASGLGATSAYTWLKLPVVDELDRVMEATSLPTLLLGGDPTAEPEATYASWGKALELPSVRGLVVGRALLFPPDGDVAAAVDRAAALVHGDTV